MAKQTDYFLTRAYNSAFQTFVDADALAIKNICTAGADDSNVVMISITSTDTVARNILFYIFNTTTNFPIGTVSIPIAAGTNGTTAAVNGLNASLPFLLIDAVGNFYLPLKAGQSLRASMLVAVAATRTITITATLGDF